jgi:hypothetical protein
MVGLAGHLNAALLTTTPADQYRHRPESLSALLPDHLGIHTIRGGGVAPAGRAVTRFMVMRCPTTSAPTRPTVMPNHRLRIYPDRLGLG